MSGRPASTDWNVPLRPGPLELGFDTYFGIPVVNSHPPFVYVKDHSVVGLEKDDRLASRMNRIRSQPTAPHAQRETTNHGN